MVDKIDKAKRISNMNHIVCYVSLQPLQKLSTGTFIKKLPLRVEFVFEPKKHVGFIV
jgi:hypothetical protein